MAAKDIYHNHVRIALEKDGWTITHDPLTIALENTSDNLFVDLGAERLIAAEKASRKIAVEVKSFISGSKMTDLENALGQYTLYHDILEENEPDRILYLAIREDVFTTIIKQAFWTLLLRKKRLRLIIFDDINQEILRWIP
ncbi:MAG TPA: element excision factor XisH family protein [Blastocatellia bacterium]|nr:element excision factor XisH family protein [Blastocatellia bacterium]